MKRKWASGWRRCGVSHPVLDTGSTTLDGYRVVARYDEVSYPFDCIVIFSNRS